MRSRHTDKALRLRSRWASLTAAAAVLAITVSAEALPKIYICGDSRVKDYQDDVAAIVKNDAETKYFDCGVIRDAGDKAGSIKDAAIIYFTGGLDDFTCIADEDDPAMTPRIQKRLDSFKSYLTYSIDKISSSAPNATHVFSTILGCLACSQPKYPYRSDGYNQACDRTTCRRRRIDCKTFNAAEVEIVRRRDIPVQDMFD
jgi:hypothetical protein